MDKFPVETLEGLLTVAYVAIAIFTMAIIATI
jgi:hypothetical protein